MIELLCIDVDGTLTNGSLVYGYLRESCGNLSLDKHSADLGFFGVSQTQSLVSHPKFAENYESTTAIPSVVDSANAESNKMQNLQSNNRSNGGVALRCFDAEQAKIGPNRPLSEVSYQNNANEYPRTNCKQDDAFIAEISKTFNVKDGLAIAYWRKVLNRKVAIITGKGSEILRVRANELQIPSDLLFMNVRDKGKIVRELKQRFTLESTQIAAVGDDLNDISMFAESALNFAPNDCANAFKNSTIKNLPNITILNAKGGKGAVRESIELILQKEKLYEKFIKYWQ